MEYKNKYYWTFQIETSRFGGVMRPSCDYVTDENREAWQRFVENKIREVMKPETMELLEFKECLKDVQDDKQANGSVSLDVRPGTLRMYDSTAEDVRPKQKASERILQSFCQIVF